MKMKWVENEIRKFKIARRFRATLKEFKTKEDLKICSKCYHTYIMECIVKGKDCLSVKLPAKYSICALKIYLGKNGFKIFEEHKLGNFTTYDIARI